MKFFKKIQAATKDIVSDVANLSSGTLSTLTGLKDYKDLDLFQQVFTDYVWTSDKHFANWQVAFESMLKDYKISKTPEGVKKFSQKYFPKK